MEPKGSLPYTQKPATCPYSEPDQSSPWLHPTSRKSASIFPPIYTWVFQVISFPQVSTLKPCMHLSLPHPCYISCPSFFRLYRRISPVPRPLCMVRNMFNFFYGEELLAPRLSPKLDDHSLSAVRNCLLNIFSVTLHMWSPFLHPQPEDASCHGDRDPFLKYSKQTESKEKRPQDDQDVFCHSASYRALVAYLCLQSEAPYFLSALTAVMSTPDICIATAERWTLLAAS